MKKIFLVTLNKEAVSTLETIKDLGVMHVEHLRIPGGAKIDELRHHQQNLSKAIMILSQGERSVQQTAIDDWQRAVKEILDSMALVEQLKGDIDKCQAQIDFWEPWDDFHPADIRYLEEQGIFVWLVQIPLKDFSKVPPGVLCTTILTKEKLANCLLISDEKLDLPFEAIPPLTHGLSELRKIKERDHRKILEAQEKIRSSSQYLDHCKQILLTIEDELTFQEVFAGRGEEGALSYVKGFCPIDRCRDLQELAKKKQWALSIEDPSQEDKVPTLLRNPRWVRLIEPVYNMMNIIPGYRELDISPFFLIFFTIFFGMLVGDAGYGLIFLLLTLFAHWKYGKKMPNKIFFYLTYVLSTVTIIWGLLTGTVFGTLLFSQIFKPVLPWLTKIENVQLLCFALGAVHLTISHLWRFINKLSKPMGMLSEIGWITLLWVAFFLAKVLILGSPFSTSIIFFAVMAILLIAADIIVQRQEVGSNLFLLFFSVIGAFTDVVSYIRLFAVGLATVSIADAFNQIALGIGFQNIFKAVLASIVLVFVHLFLNLILAILGVLVHGLRLNILEFSSHLNLEWTGIKYEPLRNLQTAKA